MRFEGSSDSRKSRVPPSEHEKFNLHEFNVGIMCSCLNHIRFFFQNQIQHWFNMNFSFPLVGSIGNVEILCNQYCFMVNQTLELIWSILKFGIVFLKK